MDEIVALCKRRGFIFPSSDIYGGIAGFWDYGPLGVELKNNIKKNWWKSIVYDREDVVGVDASIIMNPKVWEASGHVAAFTDPLVECEICHKRFRPDKLPSFEPYNKNNQLQGYIYHETECPSGGHRLKVIIQQLNEIDQKKIVKPRNFNLLVTAQIGVVDRQDVYLRGEITQGVFVNFKNVVDSSRVKIPFGIAQIGKAFRNEITPGNFTYRSREFEQMELEFFLKPEEQTGNQWFEYWKKQRMDWYISLGMKKENLRFRQHAPDERAHYARAAFDIEYKAPFGWSEFEGIHHRGDWDLSRHKLNYKDESGTEYTAWVIETSGGVDRAALFFLLNAYAKEEKRTVLRLHPKLAPIKAAVFPLVNNKPQIVDAARRLYLDLKKEIYPIKFDDSDNIGKRYRRHDEIGTPYCVTVDYRTLEDQSVTVRDRDSMQQERVKIGDLNQRFKKLLFF